ncbi:MAG: hypothetical protein EA398_13510 [Deltaproteobacteria bacterium]|nr:MAG: hypothetical protein EA398_13510 [Deltaproteobacteria bacterium]
MVAIAGGNLYYQNEGDPEFTEVSASFSETAQVSFSPYIIGGNPALYIADGTLYRWDGTTVEEVSGAPAATQVQVYKKRMFALDGSTTVYWSRVDDPTDWASPNGGQSNVEVYDSDPLTALGVTGSSLLLAKKNTIARFTGTSAQNIRVDQNTEGVSPNVGSITPWMIPMDEALFFISDRGPFIATESGVQPVGMKVEPIFDAAELGRFDEASLVFNRYRREVVCHLPGAGAYAFDTRTGGWYGEWEYSGQFGVASSCRYELDDGKESILLGGDDGYVREGDSRDGSARDDRLADGSRGVPVEMELYFDNVFFGDPSAVKLMNGANQHFGLDLGNAGRPQIVVESDLAGDTSSQQVVSGGPGVKQYAVNFGGYGRRMSVWVKDNSGEVIRLHGWTLSARVSGRNL